MGILSGIFQEQYEKQLDGALVGTGYLNLDLRRQCLESVLSRIQWNISIVYGTLYRTKTNESEKDYQEKYKRLINIMDSYETKVLNIRDNYGRQSGYGTVLSMISKLKCRDLTEDEILMYELDFAIETVIST